MLSSAVTVSWGRRDCTGGYTDGAYGDRVGQVEVETTPQSFPSSSASCGSLQTTTLWMRCPAIICATFVSGVRGGR